MAFLDDLRGLKCSSCKFYRENKFNAHRTVILCTLDNTQIKKRKKACERFEEAET